MEPWPQYHNYATLATMAFGVFLWLILLVLLHSSIAINHHIVYKLWWTCHVIDPTCQFEGLHKKFEEIWHGFGPLWVCVAPVKKMHWGVALCAPRPLCVPRPCVYVPCRENCLLLCSKHAQCTLKHFAMSPYELDLHNGFDFGGNLYIKIWKSCVKVLLLQKPIFLMLCFETFSLT